MALSIGIVGLPNVGKSTLFNALTRARNAEAANYPFCTIEPNKAGVPVPDKRLDALARLVRPQKIVHALVDFIDIAGLVRGASKGEGLGNQFLGNIRECSAILHVVRAFEDDNVTHVDGAINPARDVETIETELILSDIEAVAKRREKTARQAKGDKTAQALTAELDKLLEHLDTAAPAATFFEAFPGMSEAMRLCFKEMGLLSAKKVVYCANVDEETLTRGSPALTALKKLAERRGAPLVPICAKIEEELEGLSEKERAEMLASYGIDEPGLNLVIKVSYDALGLISYFTAGEKEVRAWTIQKGWKAPQAASVIHTDFEKGFIRAEIIAYDDYIRLESESAARAAGLLRTEGRDYIMKDGDVTHFLFNV